MKFLTAGESHGKGLSCILEGVPSGVHLSMQKIAADLSRRQRFLGRSERMKLEDDSVEFLGGVRGGYSTGTPISFFIKNNDCRMDLLQSVEGVYPITSPRPGHADFAGMVKYQKTDARDIAERASGRETAARTVVGAISKIILASLGISVASHTINIGGNKSSAGYYADNSLICGDFLEHADADPVRCLDKQASKKMAQLIEEAGKLGDTLGGEVEIVLRGLPIGFGSHVHYEKRLDFALSGMLMSIPSVKSVGIGNTDAFCSAGSLASDPIMLKDGKIIRPLNNAGGIEGGISNGQDIVIRLTIKPPPTMKNGATTVDFVSKQMVSAHYERSDICIVPTVSVVAEGVVAFVIANVIVGELGADTMAELMARFEQKRQQMELLLQKGESHVAP